MPLPVRKKIFIQQLCVCVIQIHMELVCNSSVYSSDNILNKQLHQNDFTSVSEKCNKGLGMYGPGCTHQTGQGGPLLTDLMSLHCLNQDKLNYISE